MSGDVSFLSNKFTPAALPLVCAPRRELLSVITEAAKDGFIYIHAPAGSGKTVSALLWLLEASRKSLWIGLDAYDNAIAVFYKLIATSLYSTQPENLNIKAVIEDAAFSASPVEHTISLISEMLPDVTPRALIIDDMHLVANAEIAKSLPFVLKRLPQSFVTLILSRAELPASFSSLIKNERQIISAKHLRFSQNEIYEYFKSLGRFLSREETGIVRLATDGWAIGVNAVGQSGDFSMQERGGVFAQFFEKHIWNTWEHDLRDFCLKTAVVDEFDAALAGRLSGRSDARELMERLSGANYFISRIRDDTYRYHHLFTEFLRERLPRTEAAVLCKIAANYYMEQRDYSMALRFWLDSGDYKGADKFLFLFMFDNHHGDIAGYVDFLRLYFMRDFSADAFRDFPALHVCCAWYYYMTGDYKAYERHADEGYRHIIRIALYDPKFVEFAMLMYSVDHRSEMLDKVRRFGALGKLVRHFSRDGIIRYIASCTHNLPYAHRSSFDYTEAASSAANIKRLRKSAFNTLLGDQSETVFSLGIAGCCYERNDLHGAWLEMEKLDGVMTENSSIEFQVSAKFLRHSILHRMERSGEAAAALADLTEFVAASAPFFSANLEAYKAKLKLMDCDRSAARGWLDKYYVVEAERIELYLLFQHFTTARAYLALCDTVRARRYLVMLRDFCSSLNRTCDYCEATVLLAALEWAEGNKKEAVAALEEALAKLGRHEYSRIVIDEGAAILPVLKRIALKMARPDYTDARSREFVSALVQQTHRFAKSHRGITAELSGRIKPTKLSKQQRRVVELLGRGYSNAMIVAETGLKITTIKTHTAIAYQKLGVNNSIDAVLKARDLGLIE